ncbi:hypothetical protein CRENBAI_021102 [Crenichthys baileyi]|uniref:Kazrin n=1 Tax=Crenichthys baileyi TaxID=28760 RepID=A0AAV9S4A2_9TELE
MEDNKQLAQRIDGAIQSASQEVTNLRSELSATSRKLAELGASSPPALENHLQHNHHEDSLRYRVDSFSLKLSMGMTVEKERRTRGRLNVVIRQEGLGLESVGWNQSEFGFPGSSWALLGLSFLQISMSDSLLKFGNGSVKRNHALGTESGC